MMRTMKPDWRAISQRTPFSGSIVDGQTTMESNPGCGSCHTYNATDGTFSALGGDPIDVNAFRYPADPGNDYDRNFPVPSGPAHLSSFIETEMQLFGACTGACADNVAEYLWSLRD